MSKHVIKARDSRLALVDIAVEEILSSDDEADTQSEENEEDISGESTKSLVHDEDFEVFYVQTRLRIYHPA